MPEPVPLTTLLSRLWIAHCIEIDNAFEAVSADRVGGHFRISLPMWTNGLRHIDEDGVTVDELRARARASCNLGGLERWRWISVDPDVKGRRTGYGSHREITGSTVLRPTGAGRYARAAWPKVVQGIEDRWRTRFGAAVVEELRTVLLARAASAPPLPWSPPEVHPPDGFRTTVVDAPKTGADQLPLAALLGQALTDVTLAHEREAQVSLPIAANLLRVIDRVTVRLRDVPKLSGISKEAVAMAVTFLDRHELATTNAERAITLTPYGLDAVDEYRELSSRAADTELREALDAVLRQTAQLSEGLQPREGGWRAANPYLAQTKRLVAGPAGALPWHPMVLHRGGWPDGS